jgi:large subunit ribosomal protein L22
MEVRAIAKYVRVQPRKVRIIADEVRGRSATYSSALLRYHPSKSARLLRKVLESAIANAQENHSLEPERLRIATIMIDEGPRLKRMRARAMGRGNRIIKKTSHITVVVEDYEGEQKVKPHGTKAKPRPTFAAPKSRKGKASTAAAAGTPKPEATEEVREVEVAAENVAEPEEATPVAASEAPEEKGGAEEISHDDETTPEAEGATGQAEDAEQKGAE